jgi:GAF domain-containing protein
MARPSKTGGKTGQAKARKASPAKGRKASKTKYRIARSAAPVKHRLAATPSKDLKAARKQQAATAEILKVIASSPSDVQPVLEAVAERAMSLLDAWSVLVTRFDGQVLGFGAARGALPDTEQFLRNNYPMPPEGAAFAGRCILERSAINLSNAQCDPSEQNRNRARLRGFRAALSVPMLRDGQPIGVITVSRREAGAFAANEVELLQTFADQAVIAIENVRLFEETKQALEQQRATSEVLQVIGNSIADTAPVFEKILDCCQRLFATEQLGVFLARDGEAHVAAWRGRAFGAMVATFPKPLEQTATGLAIQNRRVLSVPSAAAMSDMPPAVNDIYQRIGDFSAVWAPMLRDGRGVGVIVALREPPSPFSEKEIALLETFAEQAAIAIDNTRLFNEVQAKTRDLTESLEQQTATSEVLSVISRSPTDAQPVFEAIAKSAALLCDAVLSNVQLFDGELLHIAATYNFNCEVLQQFYDMFQGARTIRRLPVGPS